MKKTIIACGLMFALSTASLAFAQEKFTVSGTIAFPKTGTLVIALMTETEYQHHEQEDRERQEQQSIPQLTQAIEIDKEKAAQKSVAFAFKDVPAGAYTIFCYQDVNNNGKLDEGMFGPKEPHGTYIGEKGGFGPPKFEEIKFDIKQDMINIAITLK